MNRVLNPLAEAGVQRNDVGQVSVYGKAINPESKSESAIPSELRDHFARHNRRVIFLALGTFIFVAVAWAVLYWLLYWLVLLGLTAIQGVDAQPPTLLPVCFVGSALLLCALVFITHRFSPQERLRDRKSPWEIALDFILAIPRSTLSLWGTLTAYQFLDEREMRCAWNLLRFIGKARRIELQAVAREIADPRTQERVVIALQLVGLVELLQTDEGLRLVLRDEKAKQLAQPQMRLDLRQARRPRER